MEKLIDKIKKIPKGYFSALDVQKISSLTPATIKVTLSRMVASEQLIKVGQRLYTTDIKNIDWEKFSVEVYAPSYISFEYALARHNILSQKPHSLTLATSKRTNTVFTRVNELHYHHLNPSHYWGYLYEAGVLIAEPEKAFLDLAYLSLNGYAKFDAEEMNLGLLNKTKLASYLKKFKSTKLNNLIKNILVKL